MFRKSVAPHIVFLTLVLAFSACQKPQYLQYKTTDNFKLESVGLSRSTVSMDVHIFNPNKVGGDLKKADIDISINDIQIGKAIINKKVHIPAKKEFILPIIFSADMMKLIPGGMQLLTNRNKTVTIKAKGYISAGKGVCVKLPIDYTTKQTIKF